jgi:ATP-grasp domain
VTRSLVAVLHHARSFFPLDLYQQVGDAAELLWVVDRDSGACEELRLLRRLGTVVEISGGDHDGAARTLAAHRPQGIVAFVDDQVVLAAELALRLGLPYHAPEVARTVVHKGRQRQVLRDAGIPGPRFWLLPAGLSRAALSARAGAIAYPGVLKPAEGSGSRGILGIAGARDLCAAYRPDREWVLEEYLPDDPGCDERFASYLSVESVVAQGRRHHVALTGRFALAEPFRETGNFVPAAVEPPVAREVLALADAAIDALGITTGVLHTEIKLTPDGPRLIEVNGRLGGRPPFVLCRVSELNLFRVACRVALGDPVPEGGLARCDGVAYWRMIQPPRSARRVRTVGGLDEVAAEPCVDSVTLARHPQDAVDWREGTAGQVVTVRGRVPDLDALAQTIAVIDRTVSVTYDGPADTPLAARLAPA